MNAPVDADAALEIGLVTRVVADDALDAEVETVARPLPPGRAAQAGRGETAAAHEPRRLARPAPRGGGGCARPFGRASRRQRRHRRVHRKRPPVE